jgi:hypothetical protein
MADAGRQHTDRWRVVPRPHHDDSVNDEAITKQL